MSKPSRDVVAGIGFRHAASAEAIAALVTTALARAALSPARLGMLATAEDRAHEPAFVAAVEALEVSGIGLETTALHAVDSRVPTRSARIEVSRGVGSLAEAAALAAAGDQGRLVLARIANEAGDVTCALALASEPL